MEIYSVPVFKVPRLSKLGQKVYFIKMVNVETLSTICTICNNTKKITYRGKEFDCPNCNGFGKCHTYTVKKPDVIECIINEVYIKGPYSRLAWSDKGQHEEKNQPRIWNVYARWKTIDRIRVPDDNYVDPEPSEEMISALLKCDDYTQYAFTSKKATEPFVDAIVAAEKQELLEFNEKCGTNYEYPDN